MRNSPFRNQRQTTERAVVNKRQRDERVSSRTALSPRPEASSITNGSSSESPSSRATCHTLAGNTSALEVPGKKKKSEATCAVDKKKTSLLRNSCSGRMSNAAGHPLDANGSTPPYLNMNISRVLDNSRNEAEHVRGPAASRRFSSLLKRAQDLPGSLTFRPRHLVLVSQSRDNLSFAHSHTRNTHTLAGAVSPRPVLRRRLAFRRHGVHRVRRRRLR